MSGHRLHTSLVVHSNHANEIDQHLAEALQRARAAGIILLNQTVLLKGVNDSLPVLSDLSERLFASGVLPYYLRLLDKVTVAQHFDVEPERALTLHQQVHDTRPRYLVSTLV